MTPYAWLESAAAQSPERLFIDDGSQALTYGQTLGWARQLAENVLGGLEPGETVALMLPNSVHLIAWSFAVFHRGGVVTMLHPGMPVTLMRTCLKDSEACRLVVTRDQFSKVKADISGLEIFIAEDSTWSTEDTRSSSSLQPRAVENASPALILFTSGTTGRPKGVVLTQGNCLTMARMLARDFWQIGDKDTVLMLAPGSHIFGQAMMLCSCHARAGLRLVPHFHPGILGAILKQSGATFTAGPPTIARLLLKMFNGPPEKLSKIMLGGAKVPEDLIGDLKTQLRLQVVVGYGLTEGVPLSFYSADMGSIPPETVGRAPEGSELAVLDEQRQSVPHGEIGEIAARGPQVCAGYLKRPKEDTRAFANGWFLTGDMGWLDEEGFLFLSGRKDDMIKSAGYKVFPEEVEAVLNKHPHIDQSAVVGLDNELRGTEIVAFVVPREGKAPQSSELGRYCRERLFHHKCPKRFHFMASLPLSPTGKILRRELVASLEQGNTSS